MTRRAVIAGVYEEPRRSIPDRSVLQIKAHCARLALEDAGLRWADVDGLYDCGEGDPSLSGVAVAEYFGIAPKVIDAVSVGGSGYEVLAAHAAADIRAGRVEVALISYGSTLRQQSRSGGLRLPDDAPTPIRNLERPYGLTLVGNYALSAARHIADFGTTPEQLASIAVTTRRHALRNPMATEGLRSIGIKQVAELSVDTVLSSRMVADPLHVYDCCLITDGGGAVVIVSQDVAKGIRKRGVEILGTADAVSWLRPGSTVTSTAATVSGPRAFEEAGVKAADVDIAMLYDSFTITVLMLLEDLGFCAKGDGGPYAASGVLDFDNPDGPALNTDGGGLSSTHPGMRGIYLLIEAVRQLRGESTSQVAGAHIAVAHGNGGMMATRHSGATVVLGVLR